MWTCPLRLANGCHPCVTNGRKPTLLPYYSYKRDDLVFHVKGDLQRIFQAKKVAETSEALEKERLNEELSKQNKSLEECLKESLGFVENLRSENEEMKSELSRLKAVVDCLGLQKNAMGEIIKAMEVERELLTRTSDCSEGKEFGLRLEMKAKDSLYSSEIEMLKRNISEADVQVKDARAKMEALASTPANLLSSGQSLIQGKSYPDCVQELVADLMIQNNVSGRQAGNVIDNVLTHMHVFVPSMNRQIPSEQTAMRCLATKHTAGRAHFLMRAGDLEDLFIVPDGTTSSRQHVDVCNFGGFLPSGESVMICLHLNRTLKIEKAAESAKVLADSVKGLRDEQIQLKEKFYKAYN